MSPAPDILCIGAVLWDVIGRADRSMAVGHDVPGRIRRLPGGVAMNVARACLREGMRPALLTLLGRDAEGRALADACAAMGLDCTHVTWADDLPTDVYMAIEAEGALIAAVADARSLEEAGARILEPLEDGALGTAARPYPGTIALDGNLSADLLAEIAGSPLFASADLRLAPASPGKALRLVPLLTHPRATVYLNRIEAGLICGERFPGAAEAAEALAARGVRRALVTDGGALTAETGPSGLLVATPPAVAVARVTGAGDTFMAAHIAAERRGLAGTAALDAALAATAAYVSAVDD